jgi:DNA-binding MurR/RpiR family transcriptional regulator
VHGSASRVLELFEGQRLTPAQRRIAQCLVEHATDAGYLSSSEIAELAQVSQPSVTRFAIALGFDGYPGLRRRIRELVGGAPAGGADDHNDLQEAVAGEADNLARLAGWLADRRPVEEAGKLLAASRPLPVLGLRSAVPVATYFAYFAMKMHPDVRLLDGGGSACVDRLEQARAAGASALLAFVLPRYPREAHDAIREAKQLGLFTVVVTDSPVNAVAADADRVLPAPVGSRLVFDLHTAPLALAGVLLQAMGDATPTQTQSRLEAFEQSAARRQVFLQ